MRTSDRLARALANPKLFFRGFNRAVHTRFGTRSSNPAGIDVFSEDWDSLFVLDACRFDMFRTCWDGGGSVSSVISKGSSTVEWLQANFDGRDLTDTVYVTANPQLERNREKWDISLHDTINVWLEEGWDEEDGTVRAEDMNQFVLRAEEMYPNKRLVFHYMQPHYPFVQSETKIDKKHLEQINSKGSKASGENIWGKQLLGRSDLSDDELWEMYSKNLNYVIGQVNKVLQKSSGKVVISSDHGNYVGDKSSPIPLREYGHPRGVYHAPLVEVPWVELDDEERKKVVSDKRDETSKVRDELADERLSHLGYT